MSQGRNWLLGLIVLFCYLRPCTSQSFRVDPFGLDGTGGYWPKWDSTQDRLILYRDVDSPAIPAARLFGKAGGSVPIYVQRDLPQSSYVDVWNAAATPDGGLVLSSVVGYTPRGAKPAELKSFLLTYDAAGLLKKVWNVQPYNHTLVAVDRSGNVFALGDARLRQPYPLLVKYSPSGKVLRQFLSSGLFAEGDRVIANGSPHGDNQMWVQGDELLFWVASRQELLSFSLGGVLLRRTSLASAFDDLAAATDSDRVRVKMLTVRSEAQILAQIQLWPKRADQPVRLMMVQLPRDGTKASLLPTNAEQVRWFLGTTREGKLMFLEPEPGGRAGLLREYPFNSVQ